MEDWKPLTFPDNINNLVAPPYWKMLKDLCNDQESLRQGNCLRLKEEHNKKVWFESGREGLVVLLNQLNQKISWKVMLVIWMVLAGPYGVSKLSIIRMKGDWWLCSFVVVVRHFRYLVLLYVTSQCSPSRLLWNLFITYSQSIWCCFYISLEIVLEGKCFPILFFSFIRK